MTKYTHEESTHPHAGITIRKAADDDYVVQWIFANGAGGAWRLKSEPAAQLFAEGFVAGLGSLHKMTTAKIPITAPTLTHVLDNAASWTIRKQSDHH
jgi:hypothetical protein